MDYASQLAEYTKNLKRIQTAIESTIDNCEHLDQIEAEERAFRKVTVDFKTGNPYERALLADCIRGQHGRNATTVIVRSAPNRKSVWIKSRGKNLTT